MTDSQSKKPKDRVKDRSDVGTVELPIDKLMRFREANASCVHIEAALEADRRLTEPRKRRPR